jgi:hypothetical protein
MKSSGFDIEKTHLKDIQKNRKIDFISNDRICLVL